MEEHPWTLRRVVLLETNAVSFLFASDKIDPSLTQQVSFEMDLGRDPEAGGMLVRLRVISVHEEQSPYDISATWAAEFAVPGEVSDEDALAFARTSGVLVVWPYARAHLADLTTRMGFAPLQLPTIAIPPPEVVTERVAEAPQGQAVKQDGN